MLGGHWQLLPGEPASVSYASPPALSPWTEERERQREEEEGVVYWKIITALRWSTGKHRFMHAILEMTGLKMR